MKKIIAFLLCILTVFALCSCGEKADPPKDTETSEQTEQGQHTEDIVENGKTVGKSYYDGDRLTKEEYFETSGNLSRTVEYAEDGTTIDTSIKDGKKVRKTVKNSEGITVSSETFDDNGSTKDTYEGGNIVLSETFDKEGKLAGSTSVKYNENGQRTESDTVNGKGELLYHTVYDYDGSKLKGFTMYNSEGNVYRSGLYDEEGHLNLYDANWNLVQTSGN